MDKDALDNLLRKTESEHVEFKEAKSSFDFDKLVEYTIALANERGGELVLGVSDKKPHAVVGTQVYKDDMAKIKERLIAQTRLRIEVEEIHDSKGRVLVFHVPSRPIGMPLNLRQTGVVSNLTQNYPPSARISPYSIKSLDCFKLHPVPELTQLEANRWKRRVKGEE